MFTVSIERHTQAPSPAPGSAGKGAQAESLTGKCFANLTFDPSKKGGLNPDDRPASCRSYLPTPPERSLAANGKPIFHLPLVGFIVRAADCSLQRPSFRLARLFGKLLANGKLTSHLPLVECSLEPQQLERSACLKTCFGGHRRLR